MAYTKYSLTPSSNTAAPPDGAPEGMLPSAVNDTMRDMMAQIRDCGDGIRGGTYTMTAPVITGGSINGTTTITTSGAISYTGTLTGGTGVVNLGSGQFYKDASGAIGIGTSTITSGIKLQITGNTLIPITNSYHCFSLDYGMGTPDSSGLQIYTGTSDVMRFGQRSSGTFTERIRIDQSGSLLVGCIVNPGNRTLGFSANAGGLGIDIYQAANTSDWAINSTAGNIVNFYSDNGSALVYAGSIQVNGNITSYLSVSDYRLKTVIGNVFDSGQRIDALEPIEYDWNSGGRTRGFLAHQFAEVYPNSVSGEKDAVDSDGKPAYQSMQSSSPEVMADLIAEIQSLRKRVATLEAK